MARKPGGDIPPFNDSKWSRVHHRIRPYLDRGTDFFRLQLKGRHGQVLLDIPISHCSKEAHEVFYKDFLMYVRDHFFTMDISELGNSLAKAADDQLFVLTLLCETKPVPLPKEVVEQLFDGCD